MFLTKALHKSNISYAKTMICKSLYVNDVNNLKYHSHARSHDKALNNNKIYDPCERVNNFSCAHVRSYFIFPFFMYFYPAYCVFIFFILTCVSVLLFTYSHLNKINIKTIAYHVNDIKNSFTRHSHCSHEG